MLANKENIYRNSYFNITEINNKENIDMNSFPQTIKEENDYFEKRSNRQQLLFRLENENYIYEDEFKSMKNHLKYLEMTKASLMKEINNKSNYMKSLEEKEREYDNKIIKSIENSEKIKKNLRQNLQEKNNMIEKIEDFEKKSKEENEKLSNISKNVKYLFSFYLP